MLSTLLSLSLAVGPLLDFQAGTMLVESPASFGADTRFAPWSLNDGQPDTGWCSAKGVPGPYTFVYELDALSRLDALKLDTRQVQEKAYPGSSAKDVELWVSSSSATEGFRKVLSVQLAPGELKGVKLPPGTQGRWLKLVVRSNHGHRDFTQLMEAMVYGDKLEPPARSSALSGRWNTYLYESLQLAQDGDQLYGCYRYRNFVGKVRGAVWGRLGRVTWEEARVDGLFPSHGSAAFQVSADGQKLAGLWFTADGALGGTWDGLRAKADEKVSCEKLPVAEQASDEKATLYGLPFAPGAAALEPEAAASVGRLAEAARAQPKQKLTLVVHGEDAKLGAERARVLKAALVDSGVPEGQLDISAAAAPEPVAAGKSAQARALNERVVLEAVKRPDAGQPADAGR